LRSEISSHERSRWGFRNISEITVNTASLVVTAME
jgi:hypothetical protein